MIGVTVQMTSTWFYYRETSSTYPQYCLVLHFNLKFCILFVVFHTSTLVLFLNEYQISTFPLDLHLPGFTTGRLPQLEQCILSTVQCYTSTSNFVYCLLFSIPQHLSCSLMNIRYQHFHWIYIYLVLLQGDFLNLSNVSSVLFSVTLQPQILYKT